MKLRKLDWSEWVSPVEGYAGCGSDSRKWEDGKGNYITFNRTLNSKDSWFHSFNYTGLSPDEVIDLAKDVKDIIEYHKQKIGPKPLSDADKLEQAVELLVRVSRLIGDHDTPYGFDRIAVDIGKFFQEVVNAKK